jgi:hypothetical protein
MECTSRVVIVVVIIVVICASVPSVNSLSSYEANEENRVDGIDGIPENIVDAIDYLFANKSSETNLNTIGEFTDLTDWLNPILQSAHVENVDSHLENEAKATDLIFPANFTAYSEEKFRENKSFRETERTPKNGEGKIICHRIDSDNNIHTTLSARTGMWLSCTRK